MKWGSCLFAFYIILLAAAPCCVFDDCRNDKATAQQSAHENDDACGNCSPFFSCGGCATGTIVHQPAQFEITRVKISAIYGGYIQSSLPDVDYDFWQPPKLG